MAGVTGTKEQPWALKTPLIDESGLVELEHNARNNRTWVN
jgi:hypothetical protein